MFCLFDRHKDFTAIRAVKQLQLRDLNKRIMRWGVLKHLFILREEAQPEAADLTLKAAELHKDTDC